MTLRDKFKLWRNHYCIKHLIPMEGVCVSWICMSCHKEEEEKYENDKREFRKWVEALRQEAK